jgi:hypothetical protein
MSPSEKTLIERAGDSAIRVGRILVSAKALPDALARYSRLLFCLNGSDQYPYSLRGTATGLRWQNRCMLFWCSHQTADYQPDEVLVPLDKHGKFLISGSAFVHIVPPLPSPDEEFFDLCAMQYFPASYGDASVERGFFELLEADAWRGDPESTFMLFGYPTSLRNVDYDTTSIAVKQIVTSAKYRSASRAASVHTIEMQRAGDYSSDGLSGGPVFHLGRDAQGFYCGFAGVILRGSESSNMIHFLDVRLMFQFLRRQDSATNSKQAPSPLLVRMAPPTSSARGFSPVV